MKSMQNFHQNTRHWDDIGYQWVSSFTLCVTAYFNECSRVVTHLKFQSETPLHGRTNGRLDRWWTEGWFLDYLTMFYLQKELG
jgi:hypothetical protein